MSIAVVEGEPDPRTWRALAGAVVNPTNGETFTARAGGGAFLGGQRLSVGPAVALDQALVGTGFSYRLEPREKQIEVASELLRRSRDLRRMGSAALDLCSVAASRLDVYYEWGLHPWDQAAGALIAAEAGARVVGLDGAPASSDLLVAGLPGLVDDILPIIAAIRS